MRHASQSLNADPFATWAALLALVRCRRQVAYARTAVLSAHAAQDIAGQGPEGPHPHDSGFEDVLSRPVRRTRGVRSGTESIVTKEGSNTGKQRIRAHAAETGRSYLDAARDLTGEPRAAGSTSAGPQIWLDVPASNGTGCLMVKADQITAVRVRGPLSEASLRRSQSSAAAHAYVLQIRVPDVDPRVEWLTVARGTSETFQNHAAQALLTALAERAANCERTTTTRPVFGSVRDESDQEPLTISWR